MLVWSWGMHCFNSYPPASTRSAHKAKHKYIRRSTLYWQNSHLYYYVEIGMSTFLMGFVNWLLAFSFVDSLILYLYAALVLCVIYMYNLHNLYMQQSLILIHWCTNTINRTKHKICSSGMRKKPYIKRSGYLIISSKYYCKIHKWNCKFIKFLSRSVFIYAITSQRKFSIVVSICCVRIYQFTAHIFLSCWFYIYICQTITYFQPASNVMSFVNMFAQ